MTALLLDSPTNNQYLSADNVCDGHLMDNNGSVVVIGYLDQDVIQNINQPGLRIILIDFYGNHDEIYQRKLPMLISDLKIFHFNLCVNMKTVMHLRQFNIVMMKMVLGEETRNKHYYMQSGDVMKCVINLLTLMGNNGTIELVVPQSQLNRMHKGRGEYFLHEPSPAVNNVGNVQPDYRHIDQNMMKNYQLYFTTYRRLHNLTFRQCYVSDI